ncbi:MAG: hypothetical protein LBR74_03445 [Eubacterium sp.]|nr:hypothetical protein [Eubacterium sp.]
MNKATKEKLRLIALILPFIILFTIFTTLPIFSAFPLSFGKINLLGEISWSGFDLWESLSEDPAFWSCLKNTLFFSLLIAPVLFSISTVTAFLASRRNKIWIFIIFCLPFFTAAPVSFDYLFSNGATGFFNSLSISGGHSPKTFSDEFSTLLLSELWLSFGLSFIMLYFGFKKLPKNYRDAIAIEESPALFFELYNSLYLMPKKLLITGAIAISNGVIAGGNYPFSNHPLTLAAYAKKLIRSHRSDSASCVILLLYLLIAFICVIAWLMIRYLPGLIRILKARLFKREAK